MARLDKYPVIWSIIAVASSFVPRAAFASVGAGAGLPYEDTFSKFITSLTGPWAWTVSVVCVALFLYRAIERGGDLGGATLAFLGPAFICTLLLGVKKLMGFFGQGAMLSPACAGVSFNALARGIALALLLIGSFLMFVWPRGHRRCQVVPPQEPQNIEPPEER